METHQQHQYIAYYRVSTAKQGSSGLGLEAQRQSVHHFVRSGAIRGEYTEVESGKSNTRVALRGCVEQAGGFQFPKLDADRCRFLFCWNDYQNR